MSDVAAGPKVFLVPVGRENDHQRTIDGESPVGPCWGFTDGNHLAGRIKEGDMLLFIRAGSHRSPATIYRLGLVEQSTKNPDLASQLYKTQHNYNMGKFRLYAIIICSPRNFLVNSRRKTKTRRALHLDCPAQKGLSYYLG